MDFAEAATPEEIGTAIRNTLKLYGIVSKVIKRVRSIVRTVRWFRKQ